MSSTWSLLCMLRQQVLRVQAYKCKLHTCVSLPPYHALLGLLIAQSHPHTSARSSTSKQVTQWGRALAGQWRLLPGIS